MSTIKSKDILQPTDSERLLIEKLNLLYQSTPQVHFTIDMKGTLLDRDAYLLIKYSNESHPQEILYIWEIFEGQLLLDISNIIDLFIDEEFRKTLYTRVMTSFEIQLTIMALVSYRFPKNVLGVYTRHIRSILRFDTLKTENSFDGVSDIRIKSPQRLNNLRLECWGYDFHRSFREEIDNGMYTYIPVTEGSEDVEAFKYPNILINPLVYYITVVYDNDIPVIISFNSYMFIPEMRKKTMNNYIVTPLDRNTSHVQFFHPPPASRIVKNGVLIPHGVNNGDDTNRLKRLKETDMFKKILKQSLDRKSTFLLGLDKKIGGQSTIYRAFTSLYSETRLIRVITEMVPDY